MNSQSLPAASLPRSLPSLETWGFGFSGLLLWLGTAPAMHAALGPQALWVWLPGTIIGILLNFQVKQLGDAFPDIAGGTPNYATRLLQHFPRLARYGAIGYVLGWVSVPAIDAIILTDLIKANLTPLGVSCPELLMKIGFTVLPFLVALSGTRTLGILHTFFVIPAIGFLLVFCLQGLGWLSFAPQSPGLLPNVGSGIGLMDWLKWFFIAIYAVYGCETASSFVADSRQPTVTLRCLGVTAGLIPIVYLGGSWVLARLATTPNLGDSAYLNLLAAAQPFWGAWAPALVTFLMTSGCLLSSATAFSNCPRILYQLGQDGYLPPIFTVASPRGVLEPGLIFTLFLSLICLAWGDVFRVVMVTGTGYLASMMAVHGGLWIARRHSVARWPRIALACFGMEAVVLIVGGWAWSWQDLAIGLLLPYGVGLLATQVPRLKFAGLQPTGWMRRYSRQSNRTHSDWIAFQVSILISLICGALSLGWGIRGHLEAAHRDEQLALFSILLMTVAFVGVAIACWTTLPQIAAITEARTQLERTLNDLKKAQAQLVQAEKMSSLGQLVAGVAHEINNPVNFIHGNLTYMQQYSAELLHLVELYAAHYPDPAPEIQAEIAEVDLAFLQTDLVKVLHSMDVGTSRIRDIVRSLQSFSRTDEAEFKAVDIHEGIDSTLLILQYRLKSTSTGPKIDIVKHYGQLPAVECSAGKLNQVFMNVLVNAIDAITDANQPQREHFGNHQINHQKNQITIQTKVLGAEWVEIAIANNGPEIPAAIQSRIFDPFFTTKPVGKGTGMGMSISYQIITETHGGTLRCFSSSEQGTEFVIQIPIAQQTTKR
jgi:signal transduction histidine kinase